MGKKSDPPPPPDYAGIARQQADASAANTATQTSANRPDILTPWGSQTWQAPTADSPQWTQSTHLHPSLQEGLDAQFSAQTGRSQLAGDYIGRVQDKFGTEFNWADAPALAGSLQPGALQTGIDPAQAYSQRAEDAFYGRATSRLDPRFQQKQDDLTALLQNQGFKPGDAGYDRAMSNLGRERTDAYAAAAQDAILKGGQEAQRMQGMDVTSGQFANAAQNQAFNQQFQGNQFQNQNRQQYIAEEAARRNMPLNEMNALLSGQQVGMPSMPSFQNAGLSETPQMLSAANMGYGAQMDGYNAQQARGAATMGGLFDLGAGYLSGGGSFGF